ncbi:glucose-1-phosphate adenylyltransferase, partial [Arthrospira platensis SPKY1]|nr:glucose-1-phosphate adenylyltransferase [Arthrospira platensis SPKY1]
KKNPKFNFFDPSSPVYTHPRFLPPSRLANCNIVDSIVSEGCIIEGSEIHNSVIGIRSIISQGSSIYDSIIMGMDHLEDAPTDSRGPRGIGKNCTIHRTIIDKNARIGDGTIITSKEGFDNGDFVNYYIRDGIVIIPKNA